MNDTTDDSTNETKSLCIFIDGRAVPKARPRSGKNRHYTPEKTKRWEEVVKWTSLQACLRHPFWRKARREFMKVWITVFYKRGRSRCVHPRIADIDNVAKSILDGMNGIVYKDDYQVVELKVCKKWSEDKDLVIISVDLADFQ